MAGAPESYATSARSLSYAPLEDSVFELPQAVKALLH
jgi:hypothetical protein